MVKADGWGLVKGAGFKVPCGTWGRVLVVNIVWGSVLECKEDTFWGCQGCRGDQFGEKLVSGSHLTQLLALQPKEGPETPPSPCQCPPHCSPLPPPARTGATQCQVPAPP